MKYIKVLLALGLSFQGISASTITSTYTNNHNDTVKITFTYNYRSKTGTTWSEEVAGIVDELTINPGETCHFAQMGGNFERTITNISVTDGSSNSTVSKGDLEILASLSTIGNQDLAAKGSQRYHVTVVSTAGGAHITQISSCDGLFCSRSKCPHC